MPRNKTERDAKRANSSQYPVSLLRGNLFYFGKLFKAIVISNFSWVFIVRAYGAFCTLVFTVLIARGLSIEEIGIYFLSSTVMVLISAVSRLGTDSIIIKKIAPLYKESKSTAYAKFGEFLCLIAAMVFLILALAYVVLLIAKNYFVDYLFFEVWYVILLGVFPLSLSVTYSEYLKAGSQPVLSAVVRYALTPSLALILWLAYADGKNLVTLARISVFSLLVSCFTAFFFCYETTNKRRVNFRNVLKIINESYPLLFVSLCGLIVGWVDVLVIGFWHGSKTVALYGAATKISTFIGFVGLSVLNTYSAKMAVLAHQKKYVELNLLVRRNALISFLLGGVLVAVAVGFGRMILSVFGEEYQESYNIFILLCCAHWVNISFGPIGFSMVVLGLSKVFGKIYIGVSILIMALYVVFVPRFDLLAAALLAIISFFLVNILCTIYIRRFYLYCR